MTWRGQGVIALTTWADNADAWSKRNQFVREESSGGRPKGLLADVLTWHRVCVFGGSERISFNAILEQESNHVWQSG
jgi:hypothetical protein